MTLRPLSLLAELTYRCNLQCPYCYNPLDLRSYSRELDAAQWCDIIDQATALGVLQLHLSGGEPTLRPNDCCAIVKQARRHGLYTNLITQGTFLTDQLLDDLVAAGLDHVQISLQAAHEQLADPIAGSGVHALKIDGLKRALRYPMAVTLNCVLHSKNIDDVANLIALAESLGVRRLELANVQFYGWAFHNRAALLPQRAQVEKARDIVRKAARRLHGQIEIVHVLADYYEEYPKPCMNGWGRQFLTVTPDGRVLPCPAASSIAQLRFENVAQRPLAEIWHESSAFNTYRGTSWMPEPCRSCERREIDWGGCRCQAFLLTGDASVTDPACTKSEQHFLVEETPAPDIRELVPRRA